MASKEPISKRSGFTLIELLIVVAILTVLSAIATPNFLEAQTRAKVSRTHNDLRTLSTALETYRIDNARYPVVGNPALPSGSDIHHPLDRRLRPLTTPVSYMSSLPQDPFYSSAVGDIEGRHNLYLYAPGNLYAGAGSTYAANTYRNSIYSIAGRGPDKDIEVGKYCMAHPLAYQNKYNIYGLYDPTNGTISAGDLFRKGVGTLGQTQ